MRFAVVAVFALVAMDPWGWDRFGPLHWALLSVATLFVTARTLSTARPTSLDWRLLTGWGFLLSGLALSAALSDDRWHAVVGTPDRHLGLATWLLFFGVFLASHAWFGSSPTVPPHDASGCGDDIAEDRLVLLLVGTSIGLVAVGLYGIFELFGIGGFASGFANNRIGGTFGQPAYLGAAVVLTLPLAIALAVSPGRPAWHRSLGAAGSLGGLISLAASQSRGAWVGFAVALLVVFMANRQRIGSLSKPRRTQMAGAFVFLLVAMVAVPALRQRAWSLTDPNGVIGGRSDEWQVGLWTLVSGGKAGGVIGLGPENYRVRFGEFVDAGYVVDYGRVVFTDRSHNSLIDTALAGGWLGLAGYLLVVMAVIGSCRVLLGSGNAHNVAIGASVVGYLAQQLFLFPLAEVDPLFWIVVGLVVARAAAIQPTVRQSPITPPQLMYDAGAIVAGALALVALVAGGLDVMADRFVDRAVSEQDDDTALEHADSARQLRPDSIRYDFIAARVAQRSISEGRVSEGSVPEGSVSEEGLERALERLKDGLAISPADPALLVEQASVQLELARTAPTVERLDAALVLLRHLDEVDPNNPWTQEKYGIALALNGDIDEALLRLSKAVDLLPGAVAPLLNLAELQETAGQRDKACATLQAAEEISPNDETILNRISEKSC